MAPKYELHDTKDGRRYLIMQYLDTDVLDYISGIPAGVERD